eukprot:PhF_6_TR22388/c0_g1_i1/m.31764
MYTHLPHGMSSHHLPNCTMEHSCMCTLSHQQQHWMLGKPWKKYPSQHSCDSRGIPHGLHRTRIPLGKGTPYTSNRAAPHPYTVRYTLYFHKWTLSEKVISCFLTWHGR